MLAGVDEEPHRRRKLVPACFARPDVAHAGLAHEFGCCRGKHEIVAIGAAGKSDTTRRDGRAVRLGLSGHGILLRYLPLRPCSPVTRMLPALRGESMAHE